MNVNNGILYKSKTRWHSFYSFGAMTKQTLGVCILSRKYINNFTLFFHAEDVTYELIVSTSISENGFYISSYLPRVSQGLTVVIAHRVCHKNSISFFNQTNCCNIQLRIYTRITTINTLKYKS